MRKTRVHILSAVNAANVSKSGATYTVRDVSCAVDDIVMNRMLYPAEELAGGAGGLTGKPAPAGHPRNAEGRLISANSGDALLSAYCGAICRNARHEGGRTLVDVVVNEAQAKAHPDGARLVERLDAAISGANVEPIHVSTGLLCKAVAANGESRGRPYDRIATGIQYDHLAILLDERGAGTPEDGVGMFLNASGETEPVEAAALPAGAEDRRGEDAGRLRAWIGRLLGNGSDDVSFDAIYSGLSQALQQGAWLREVFTRYAIWTDEGGKLFQQPYTIDSGGSVAWSGTAVEVARKVEYEPVSNSQPPKETDPMKDQIIAALNATGIKTEGLDDAGLLTAYNSLVTTPLANKVAAIEANSRAAEAAEADTLAAELAVNSVLTKDDLKLLPVTRLRELKAAGKPAAPVLPGAAGGKPADEFAGYSINALLDAKPGAAAH